MADVGMVVPDVGVADDSLFESDSSGLSEGGHGGSSSIGSNSGGGTDGSNGQRWMGNSSAVGTGPVKCVHFLDDVVELSGTVNSSMGSDGGDDCGSSDCGGGDRSARGSSDSSSDGSSNSGTRDNGDIGNSNRSSSGGSDAGSDTSEDGSSSSSGAAGTGSSVPTGGDVGGSDSGDSGSGGGGCNSGGSDEESYTHACLPELLHAAERGRAEAIYQAEERDHAQCRGLLTKTYGNSVCYDFVPPW